VSLPPHAALHLIQSLAIAFIALLSCAQAQERPAFLELTRPDRPWEFVSAVGTRAGLFGNESGDLEAWVYPLKLLRSFHLRFRTEGRVIPAATLARTVIVRPESFSILYTGDSFSVREILFVPVREPGAIVKIGVETAQPLEVEAAFERDFQLEWPAALGGTYENWDEKLRAFYFGEEQKKFAAFIGSPAAGNAALEYATNYSESKENSFSLGVTNKGRETKIIAMAASVNGRDEAEATYHKLIANYSSLEQESADYYRNYVSQTVSLQLPDTQLQQAYDWARISVLQGLVTNPYLGTGLIAGYRTSGESQRPGFAWFFGRDSFWTSFALNAESDFVTTRTALDFISKFQRADGKMPHEISQGANFVGWFKNYPYPYASADATPLYIIAANDYVTQAGDVAFAQQKWESLWKAYQFLKSTYDSQGLPQNFGFGHGWVEGGPLLPVKTEFYQSGLGTEALRDLANLAHLAGKDDISKQLTQEFARQQLLLNAAFWSAGQKRYVFALDQNNQQMDESTVLATVPMWFGLVDENKAEATITQLSSHDHETDWGMRIISSASAKYGAGGYHYGSVWPLFTGWASVGEYRYHRALPAYSNLRANAMLALDGSPGHVTEVLSGDYYQQLSTSSPHQIWSAAMVISPLLRGLFGLHIDALNKVLTFAPHVPAEWNSFAIQNVPLGHDSIHLAYSKFEDSIRLETTPKGEESCTLVFSPAISLRAEVLRAELNGRPVAFQLAKTSQDQHVTVKFPLSGGPNILRIVVKNDFVLGVSPGLPALGEKSQGLRVMSETWSSQRDRLEVEVSGLAGVSYEMPVWNPGLQVASVEGAELVKAGAEVKLRFRLPPNATDPYPRERIVIHFVRSH
jgi:glycogen debranching enzyme